MMHEHYQHMIHALFVVKITKIGLSIEVTSKTPKFEKIQFQKSNNLTKLIIIHDR